ncbi:hypothetical protein CLOM_g23708 [Closterium sp. NIES-68]|nr:hypothetical protein CLOM_g23708 [Closterium sp. NIES-68]GJP66463.1 hypothetical protein CLOP_g23393 [Closterium sp. NIES-67]
MGLGGRRDASRSGKDGKDGSGSKSGADVRILATEAIPPAKRKKYKDRVKGSNAALTAGDGFSEILAPESAMLTRLQAEERQMDIVLSRVKQELSESLHSMPRVTRTLRLYVFNTHSFQDGAEQSGGKSGVDGSIAAVDVPRWTLRLVARMVGEDEERFGAQTGYFPGEKTPLSSRRVDSSDKERSLAVSAILTDAEARISDPAAGESGLSQALLGSGILKVRDAAAGPLARHVQRIEARLDPKLFPPPNDAVVLWDAETDGIFRPGATTVEMQRAGSEEVSVELHVELKHGEEVYSVGEGLGAVVGMTVGTRMQVLEAVWNHIKANKLQDPSDPSSFHCDPTLQALFKQDKLKISSLPIHISPFLSPPPPLTITHRISLTAPPTHSSTLPCSDPSFHPLAPPTSLPSYETLPSVSADTCTDVTVTEAPALAAETARVIAAMGQQPEIDAIDAAMARDAEDLAKHRRRRAFLLAFSHSPGTFIRDLMVSQQKDLDLMQQGGAEGAAGAQAGSAFGPDQDAEFYALPWVDDALLRYLNRHSMGTDSLAL